MVITKEDSTSEAGDPQINVIWPFFFSVTQPQTRQGKNKRDHGAARETHNNLQQRIKTSFEKTNSGFHFLIKEMHLLPSGLEQQEICE